MMLCPVPLHPIIGAFHSGSSVLPLKATSVGTLCTLGSLQHVSAFIIPQCISFALSLRLSRTCALVACAVTFACVSGLLYVCFAVKFCALVSYASMVRHCMGFPTCM